MQGTFLLSFFFCGVLIVCLVMLGGKLLSMSGVL